MSKSKAFSVAFCGIDGSGKSTLAARTQSWLEVEGITSTLHKTRTGRSGLERLSAALGHASLPDPMDGNGMVLMMAGIAWQSIKDSKPALRNARSIVIYDRHVPCLLALSRLYAPTIEAKVRNVFFTTPKPDLMVYVAADPLIAMSRLQSRGGTPKTSAFLRAFDEAYRNLPEAKDFLIVDGNRTADDVFDDLCETLGPYLDYTPSR
jgi:dTMP kinase